MTPTFFISCFIAIFLGAKMTPKAKKEIAEKS